MRAPGRYRRVQVQIWCDAKFRALGDDAKLLFLCLLSHPLQTSAGIMRGSAESLAREIEWPTERVSAALGRLAGAGMVEVDAACAISLPNFLKHNEPESPNVIRSWPVVLSTVPECDLLTRHLARVRAHVEGLGEGFQRAFAEAFGECGEGKPEGLPEALPEALPEGLPEGSAKSMPNPDPDPEHEPDPKEKTITRRHGGTEGKKRRRVVGGGVAREEKQTTEGTEHTEKSFDAFWERYPRKTAKAEALRAWKRLRPSPGLVAQILVAVDAQSRSSQWREQEGRYVPHGATWLRGRRWEDQLPVVKDRAIRHGAAEVVKAEGEGDADFFGD